MFRKVCVFLIRAFLNVYFKINVVNVDRFEKLKSGCVITPNHIAMWETLIVPSNSKRVMYMMAKEELFKNKFVNWLLIHLKAFPIGRGKSDIGAIKKSVDILKKGNAICMFPQGTRAKSADKLKFKTGAAMIAHTAKVPVVPVGIYAEDNYKFRSRVTVVYGEPIYFYDYYDKKLSKEELNKLTAILEEAVSKEINRAKER